MFFEWVDHFIKFAQPCPSDHDDSAHNNANTHAAEEPSCSRISNTVALAILSLPAESTKDSTPCNIYAESPTLAVHVVDISPRPKKTHSREPRRKMSKPTILTSSPHKRSLANAAETSEKVLKKRGQHLKAERAKRHQMCDLLNALFVVIQMMRT